jgi:hypothetical protein
MDSLFQAWVGLLGNSTCCLVMPSALDNPRIHCSMLQWTNSTWVELSRVSPVYSHYCSSLRRETFAGRAIARVHPCPHDRPWVECTRSDRIRPYSTPLVPLASGCPWVESPKGLYPCLSGYANMAEDNPEIHPWLPTSGPPPPKWRCLKLHL